MPGPIAPYPVTQGPVFQKGAYQQQAAKPELQNWVQSFWQLTIPCGAYGYNSLPDNCVDWIISSANLNDSFLLSPFTQAQTFTMQGPVEYFGIRFFPLGLGGLCQTALGEWADLSSVHADALLADSLPLQLFESLHRTREFQQRCALISQLLLPRLKGFDTDRRLLHFMHKCRLQHGALNHLGDRQCSEFGLSARQLRRLSQLYLGLSPKAFARVWRFQFHLQQLEKNPGLWQNHYHDQAHFIREFKTMSGTSPGQFGKLSVLYNISG
ncbi:helix-turn-helix domain-containing protein [Bowmanella denitrificans]|uniref:helix-turn-helix domain-containing protein n=1 Tax=Bowmanella denitrificans TaxID=366582 RepID=UPI000C9B4B96|nr:helix-turn-helix domain-containing protein [Bowmanella denitrificans]